MAIFALVGGVQKLLFAATVIGIRAGGACGMTGFTCISFAIQKLGFKATGIAIGT